uniref:Uncharacterized protein n=2 Tax=Timema TaxID=61471 RepID=A0A7R9JQS0_TIMGE|nr:unnamed protein product [Timema genevievae]
MPLIRTSGFTNVDEFYVRDSFMKYFNSPQGELEHALSISSPKLVLCSSDVAQRNTTTLAGSDTVSEVLVWGGETPLASKIFTSLEEVLAGVDMADTVNTTKVNESTSENSGTETGIEVEKSEHGSTAKGLENFGWTEASHYKDRVAFILGSSGSTGLPKGVMLTHNNIVAALTRRMSPTKFNPVAGTNRLAEGLMEEYLSYQTQVLVLEKRSDQFGDGRVLRRLGVPQDLSNLVKVGLNPNGNQVRRRQETGDWSGLKPTSLEHGLVNSTHSLGIFPYSPDVFSDEDIAPAKETYRIESNQTGPFAENAVEPASSTVQPSTNIVKVAEDILGDAANTVVSAGHIHSQENDSNSVTSECPLQSIELIHPLPQSQKEMAHQKLKNEEERKLYLRKERSLIPKDEIQSVEVEWERFKNNLLGAAEEVCKRTSNKRKWKETSWWKDMVEEAMEEINKAFRRSFKNRNQETEEEYREKKNRVNHDFVAEEDVALGLMPFCHAYGLILMLMCLVQGARMVIMSKFSVDTFFDVIPQFKINVLHLVPSLLSLLCKEERLAGIDLGSVCRVFTGAAPISPGIQAAVKKCLPEGTTFYHSYGLTETTFVMLSGECREDKPYSPGMLVSGMECKVVDPTTRDILGPNEKGELCFRGPLLMKGYMNNMMATQEALDEEGWLYSGDLGYYDTDGKANLSTPDRYSNPDIHFTDHLVSPSELESILLTHPAVKDVAVVGIPEPVFGELPLAYIVKQPGVSVKEEEIHKFLNVEVSSYKRLRGGVKFVDFIPKTSTGKIQRKLLAQQTPPPKEKKTCDLV